MTERRQIKLEDLVPMHLFTQDFPLRIEVAYARADNDLFGEAIYRPDAALWLHKDLAQIVLLASKICEEKHGLRYILYDGLRSVEAQEKMRNTQRALDNPHWLEEPVLLSSPGAGGHPRGMAIDISLETPGGELLDMGTIFDYLTEDARPGHNPAHRDYAHDDEVLANRAKLTESMVEAAQILGLELLPLLEEWWDFRLPPKVFEQFTALSDADLPPQMRCTDVDAPDAPPDFPAHHFEELRTRLTAKIYGVMG